jgi:large subunit ribosomal protein L18
MSNLNFKKTRTKSKINYEYPVVIIHRSNKHTIVQVLEPLTKNTLVTFDTYKEKGSKTEKSATVGNKIGEFLNTNNIEKVVFDRNGYTFTGRIQAVANGIKEKNIII